MKADGRSIGRGMNKYGITDDAPNLKIFPNPVQKIKLQFDQLTKLCEEYQAKRAVIDNNTLLSSIGKAQKYDDLIADMNRRLKNMRADSSYKVQGIDDAKMALIPKVPTTGNAVIDEIRAAEIRHTIRTMDSAQRMATVVAGNVEMVAALQASPVPFPEFSEAFLNDCSVRIALEGNQPAREKLDDLEAIASTIEINFNMAERYIAAPQF